VKSGAIKQKNLYQFFDNFGTGNALLITDNVRRSLWRVEGDRYLATFERLFAVLALSGG
jgi:hypothetical protein